MLPLARNRTPNNEAENVNTAGRDGNKNNMRATNGENHGDISAHPGRLPNIVPVESNCHANTHFRSNSRSTLSHHLRNRRLREEPIDLEKEEHLENSQGRRVRCRIEFEGDNSQTTGRDVDVPTPARIRVPEGRRGPPWLFFGSSSHTDGGEPNNADTGELSEDDQEEEPHEEEDDGAEVQQGRDLVQRGRPSTDLQANQKFLQCRSTADMVANAASNTHP